MPAWKTERWTNLALRFAHIVKACELQEKTSKSEVHKEFFNKPLFSNDNPSLSTLLAIADALNMHLTFVPKMKHAIRVST